MPSDRYTNYASPGQYLVRTSVRPQATPYVANSYTNQLTYKERLARQQIRTASIGGTGAGGGGFSGGGGMGGGTIQSSQGNFFSPQLSTDFLELPQSIRERREIYRHFYETDELVGQAIDLHTELPLSKVRLAAPKPRTCPPGFESADSYGKYILSRFERMCKKIKLFQRLITMVHHYWLDGMAVIFAEDGQIDVPEEVGYERRTVKTALLTEDGDAVEREETQLFERADREEQEFKYYQKNYKGWTKLTVLPIDKVQITSFDYTDKSILELIPSDKDKALLERASMGDPVAQRMVEEIPEEIREHIANGKLIPLGTDPDEGSFAHILTGSKSADSSLGQSILNRCHIAGTPVLAKRDGQVLQIPIEELNPDTDKVLSHAGVWRDFEIGVRSVSEEISLLHVAKMGEPIGSTSDHRYPVLRGDETVELDAKDIEPGDYLQVAQIPLNEAMNPRVDLSYIFDGVCEDYKARKSGQEVVQTLTVTDRTDTTFVVQYSKPETGFRMQKHLDGLALAAEWLRGVTEPTTIRALVFCERFGFNHNHLNRTLEKLGALGASYEVVGRSHAKTSAFDIQFSPSTMADPSKEATRTKSFPRWLALDGDLGYFLGYWLGDGHISKQDGLDYGALGFTYGPNEPASVVSIEQRIKPMLDRLKVTWSESPMGAGIHMDGYQDAVIRWMAQNFGHTCEDKCLPPWIFSAPKDFLKGLLRGFCDSDGDVTTKKDGSVSVRFSGTNKVLMDQTFLLCTSLGIPVSRCTTKRRWVKQADGSMSFAKELYAVHFTHGPSVKSFFESGFLAKRKEHDSWKDGRSGSRHKFVGDKLYYRVSKVGSAQHTGPVFSLNVHVDHSLYVSLVSTRNCLRTLYYREKLRQAQTSIASRAMTPKRIVWAEGLSEVDVDQLREQVDLSLVDPDYSIVANYEIHWEEMGSKDRLLDLSGEYEQTERRLLVGMGVTESLMSGESLYSGDRLKLEVINNRYLHLREILQEYVEDSLFAPVARRMGFVEQDEWGQEVVLYPRLSFTRLPLRDSQDTFDALYNLYQKGSISIDLILEMLNIDPSDTKSKIERDMFTVNDAIFNEILRSLYNEVGRMLADKTDILDRVSEYMNLKMKPQEGGGQEESRF